jgi:hypothetical protein
MAGWVNRQNLQTISSQIILELPDLYYHGLYFYQSLWHVRFRFSHNSQIDLGTSLTALVKSFLNNYLAATDTL